jgi:hypothetical protein
LTPCRSRAKNQTRFKPTFSTTPHEPHRPALAVHQIKSKLLQMNLRGWRYAPRPVSGRSRALTGRPIIGATCANGGGSGRLCAIRRERRCRRSIDAAPNTRTAPSLKNVAKREWTRSTKAVLRQSVG